MTAPRFAKRPIAGKPAQLRDAQSRRLSQDLGWFYNQVKNKGPWHYKQQGAQYQDFGNFNFGLTAGWTPCWSKSTPVPPTPSATAFSCCPRANAR